MVKNIPAKLEAALKAESIKRFIHPTIPEEDPLGSLSGGREKRQETPSHGRNGTSEQLPFAT